MNRRKPKASFTLLDIIRTVAMVWILLFHLRPVINGFFGRIALLDYGYLGVDLFFALSGFLIAYHYTDVLVPFDFSAYKKFLMLRLARIYPLHLVILLLLACIVLLAPLGGFTVNHPETFGTAAFIAHLFLVSAWAFPARMTWNDYAWAISALWLAYLAAPLLLGYAAKIKTTRAFCLCAVLLLALTPCAQIVLPEGSFVAYALFRVTSGFGLGILLHRWLDMKNLSLPDIAFGRRFFAVCARFSYAAYMVQLIILMLFKKLWPPGNYTDAGIAMHLGYLGAEIGCVLVAAAILHYAVEEPARKWLSAKRIARL